VISYLILFVRLLAEALNIAILARVILSWLPISRDSGLVRLLDGLTEPILGPIRRALPAMGMFDFSPFFALLLISMAERVLVLALSQLA